MPETMWDLRAVRRDCDGDLGCRSAPTDRRQRQRIRKMTRKVSKVSMVLLVLGATLMLTSPAMAQGGAPGTGTTASSPIFPGSTASHLGGAIGAGLAIMGGAAGIGRI